MVSLAVYTASVWGLSRVSRGRCGVTGAVRRLRPPVRCYELLEAPGAASLEPISVSLDRQFGGTDELALARDSQQREAGGSPVRFTTLSIQAGLATAIFVTACGSSSPSTAPSPSGTASEAAVEFRVMTFNIQHGLNGAGKYGLQAAIDTIAQVNPDLVGVQELTRNHPYYECEDQPVRIAEGLTAATGRQWSSVYQQEWTTTIRDCQNAGKGDGVETEGIGFFAPQPLSGGSWTQLWNGRVGVMTLLKRGREIPVIVTHLASGVDKESDRLKQLDALLPWTLSHGGSGPKIFIGDFNSNPSSTEYGRIHAEYHDAWTDAVAAGTARGRIDGITHKSSRIDYVFYIPSAGFELKWIDNIDTGTLVGYQASDHNPLVAAFAVR
jgi:endonuclease/exonuclease/phosphatase family metal-dependent hydrolase